MVVPIAFTSDHIETLFELDLEYIGELAKEVRIFLEIFWVKKHLKNEYLIFLGRNQKYKKM